MEDLSLIVAESGLSEERASGLAEKFQAYLKTISEWKEKAFTIVVDSEDQVALMRQAYEARGIVRDARLEVERVRKAEKDFFLKGGRFIDKLAASITDELTPIEQHLEKQANFAKVKAEEKKQELALKRAAELKEIGVEDTSVFRLSDMSDAEYNAIRQISITRRDEAARVKAEQEEAAKKLEEENAKLKKQAEEMEAERKKEREAAEKKAAEVAEEARVKLEAERTARLAMEDELSKKRAAEEKEKAEKAAKEKAEKEAAELLAKAPDVEKLSALADRIHASVGVLTSGLELSTLAAEAAFAEFESSLTQSLNKLKNF